MRHASAVLATCILVTGAVNTNAQELTEEQMEPWSALERQIELWIKQDWVNHEEYIHSKAIVWNDNLPAPVAAARTMDYIKAFFEEADEVAAHFMTPVSVTVVDNVAIINCYLHVLTRDDDGEQLESIYKLHNTWIKKDGRWQLLATCNETISEEEPDE